LIFFKYPQWRRKVKKKGVISIMTISRWQEAAKQFALASIGDYGVGEKALKQKKEKRGDEKALCGTEDPCRNGNGLLLGGGVYHSRFESGGKRKGT